MATAVKKAAPKAAPKAASPWDTIETDINEDLGEARAFLATHIERAKALNLPKFRVGPFDSEDEAQAAMAEQLRQALSERSDVTARKGSTGNFNITFVTDGELEGQTSVEEAIAELAEPEVEPEVDDDPEGDIEDDGF